MWDFHVGRRRRQISSLSRGERNRNTNTNPNPTHHNHAHTAPIEAIKSIPSMAAVSEPKFLAPIFTPNPQPQHSRFPHSLIFQTLPAKPALFISLSHSPSARFGGHGRGLSPCLAAQAIDFSLSADDPEKVSPGKEEDVERESERAVAAAASAEEKETKDRRRAVRVAWEKLVRWSRSLRAKARTDVLERTRKVVVLGGGSFGTAMAAHVADRKAEMEVNMLVRDPQVCQSINEKHFNCKYFPNHKLPENLIATTDAKVALQGAEFCLHAVPVQFTAAFLESIADHVDPGLPFISLSKGLELNTLRMMSQIIPQSLRNTRQPFVALSGPSFASELMNKLPTAMVVASRDKKLANAVQQLLASERLRINTSSDVTGVEIAGALKNVLAIAAGIVEGMNLGNNSMAALVAQGCSEIRWLAKKMGAKSATLTGLSGTGDIMLTCFVNLSRNRTVGVRLGSGETLEDILSSMNQVAEGVATAGAVITLAQKYNVKMPVLTAVARIIDNELTPQKAVLELMSLPQVEEV